MSTRSEKNGDRVTVVTAATWEASYQVKSLFREHGIVSVAPFDAVASENHGVMVPSCPRDAFKLPAMSGNPGHASSLRPA